MTDATSKSKDAKTAELKKKAKDARIYHSPAPYSRLLPDDIPEEHREKFNHIQALGRITLDTYIDIPDPQNSDKPWKHGSVTRAKTVMEFARRCRQESSNEDGWRYKVECRCFERFEIEIVWSGPRNSWLLVCVLTFLSKRCRKKIWRSEIDATGSNSQTNSLEVRRRNREPCQCMGRWYDW